MLSFPISDNYRIHLAKDFLYPDVVKNISNYTKNYMNHDNVVDYLNTTITEAKIPGINVPITRDQIKKSGSKTAKFKAFNPYKENIEKEMTLTFSLRSGYTNWAIMYMQTEYFASSESDTYLPPVYLEIMDARGFVIFRMEFREIVIKRISDLSFSTSNSIRTDKFDVQLHFNEYEIFFEYDKLLNEFDEKYHY